MTDLSRRTALIGAAVAPLAACAPPGPPKAAPDPTPGEALVSVAEVPVGSGTIAGGTLITQPKAGVFKGFVARCTHAGCALTRVVDDAVLCPCHGRSFGLDGAVLRGPAEAPLKPRPVMVRGADVVAD